MSIHGYPGATNSRAYLGCPQVQITQRLKDQFVPRMFQDCHYKYLQLSGEEVLSQLADKSYKRRLMPGWAVEELALATAKRTLFSRPTNSIKPQDTARQVSFIFIDSVSQSECRSLQILCIRSAVFPQFCQSILERQFCKIRRLRGTFMTQHVFHCFSVTEWWKMVKLPDSFAGFVLD